MKIYHINKLWFQIFQFILFISLLSISKSFHAEISLVDKNASMSLKIICIPPSEKLNLSKKHQVLWHGTQLSEKDRQKLSEQIETDFLIHNMSINASKKHRCYLVAPENFKRRLSTLKKRISREDATASIPMEDGVCAPGHRIHEDRCFPCFPGSYTSGQETECFLCPKDFYMDKKAADSCWPCPEKKKTLGQGADSEESCIYFDETGHPEISQSPPWIAIYIIIAVILVFLWIITIILYIRYRKARKEDDVDEEKILKSRRDSVSKKRLSADDHVYERISDTEMEEPIYAEIGDFDDYEEPIPSETPPYVDFDAPPPPPKRKTTERRADSIYKTPSEKISEDEYEIPIEKSSSLQSKRSSEGQYAVPIEKSSSLQSKRRSEGQYEVPSIRYSEDQYEIPVRKSSEDQYEVPIRKHSEDQYEVPIGMNSEDQYEIPIRRLSSYQSKIPIKDSSEKQFEFPIKRHSRHSSVDFHDNSKDHVYDEIKSDDEIDPVALDNDNKLQPSNSVGFDSVNRISEENVRRKPSRTMSSQVEGVRKYIPMKRRQTMGK